MVKYCFLTNPTLLQPSLATGMYDRNRKLGTIIQIRKTRDDITLICNNISTHCYEDSKISYFEISLGRKYLQNSSRSNLLDVVYFNSKWTILNKHTFFLCKQWLCIIYSFTFFMTIIPYI